MEQQWLFLLVKDVLIYYIKLPQILYSVSTNSNDEAWSMLCKEITNITTVMNSSTQRCPLPVRPPHVSSWWRLGFQQMGAVVEMTWELTKEEHEKQADLSAKKRSAEEFDSTFSCNYS